MPFKNLIKFNSLKTRYLVLSLILTTGIGAGILFAQHYVAQTEQASTRNIEERQRVERHNHQVRNAVWEAEFALELYLLMPSADAREAFHEHLREAIGHAERLSGEAWVEAHDLHEPVRDLRNNLVQLDERVGVLMKIRRDPEQTYPFFRITRGELVGLHTRFQTAVQLVLEEFDETQGDAQVRKLFLEADGAWLRTVAAFRLYLINRLGSFFEESLGHIAQGVEQQYENVLVRLQALSELEQQGKLGFQASESLQEMLAVAPRWYAGFKEIERINNSAQWRNDIPLTRDIVRPVIAEVQRTLLLIEQNLEASSESDVESQAQVAGTITGAFWALGLATMLFLIGNYLVFTRTMLNPIAQVTRGLRDEASGRTDVELPKMDYVETRHLAEAFQEMHSQVHRRQVALEHIAMHDALTELPNRVLLMDRIKQAAAAAQRRNGMLALFMMDLNRFKEINDTLGHHVGDELLRHVATRIRSLLRGSDTVARLGGDEFAILLPDTDVADVRTIAAKVINVVEQIHKVEHHNLYISASIGIAVFPHHGETPELLLQHADVAMYMAKRSNQPFAFYDTSQDSYSVQQLSLLGDLREAFENDTLDLYYQPRFSTYDGRVNGVEALLRWNHPAHGLILPGEIIPLAERTGVIKYLTHWVLNAALRQCSLWRQQGHELSVSVNLSVHDVQEPGLPAKISQFLGLWEVPPSQLELEITESVMMSHPERAKTVLNELGNLGVALSIDDYGSGYSSLAYIKSLPVDTLKIDKSFIVDMIRDANDATIVHSTIELAHNLGFRVCAEGVENEATWNRLLSLGCDCLQGFYLSGPMPTNELHAWLNTYPRRAQNA